MAWSSQKEAGFALAALLADDRDLNEVGAVLARRAAAALSGRLSPTEDKQKALREWLTVLRPALPPCSVQLPARLRGVLARLAAPDLRKRLLDGAPAARPDYTPDEELLALLLRIARNSRPSAAS